jgi:hypothetical protein
VGRGEAASSILVRGSGWQPGIGSAGSAGAGGGAHVVLGDGADCSHHSIVLHNCPPCHQAVGSEASTA